MILEHKLLIYIYDQEFKILKEQDNSLKMDKEIIEIQKTIIYYGQKTLHYCEQMTLDLESILIHKINDKGKEKQITIIEQKEIEISKNPFLSQLEKLKDVNK